MNNKFSELKIEMTAAAPRYNSFKGSKSNRKDFIDNYESMIRCEDLTTDEKSKLTTLMMSLSETIFEARNNIRYNQDFEMNLIDINDLPEKKFLIERLMIERGNLTLLCGTGSSGKTMFGQYLACCVDSGKPMFDSFEVNRGKVLHVDEEQSTNQTLRRYSRIGKGLNLTSLHVNRVKAKDYLDKDNDFEKLENDLVHDYEGYSLVFIDSLKKISCADENSAEIANILHTLKKVAERVGCAIVLVHHKGKGKDAKQSGRGHSSIYDSVDVQIDLDSVGGVVRAACAKGRDGEFNDLSFNYVDSGAYSVKQKCSEMLVFNLISDSNVKSKMASIQDRVLEALAIHEMKHGDLYDIIKGDRSEFTKTLEEMVELGKISESRGGKNARIFSITEKGKALGDWK